MMRLYFSQAARWGIVGVILTVGVLFMMSLGSTPISAFLNGTPNTADLVVQLGNGDVLVRHVAFTETSISGLELLQRSGLELGIAEFDIGSGVCSIEGTGCPVDDCFCSTILYWNYAHQEDAQWASSMVGAGDYDVTDGAVEGWSWGQTLPPVTDEILASQAALAWLAPQQQPNGSFGDNTGITLDGVLAVASANADPNEVQSDQKKSLVDYIEQEGSQYAAIGAREAGKLALGVAAADLDPRHFMGMDLVISMTNAYSPTTGSFGNNNWDQAFAMLGWRAAGEMVPITATQLLASRANADGGWGFAAGSDSEVDSTGLVLEALIAAGEPMTSTAIINAVAYLDVVQSGELPMGMMIYLPLVSGASGTVQISETTAQEEALTGQIARLATTQGGNPDGGFPVSLGGDSNSNSTGFAVQAILASGNDPLTSTWSVSDSTPIDYLLNLQVAEGGIAFVNAADGANLFATVQALPALVGKPFPYLSRAVASRKALAWMATQQQADGSFTGFGAGSTIDAVLAIAAAGEEPQSYISGEGNTALDYLEVVATDYISGNAAATGKLLTGVIAGAGEPTDFAGMNLIEELQAHYNSQTGQYGAGSTYDQVWALLGLAASSESIPTNTISYLESLQVEGGGWGFTTDAADPDTTALALQALAAAGIERSNSAVSAAFDYLHRVQNFEGGFGFASDTSASSTALVIQALAAYDEDPKSLTWTKTITDGTSSRLTLYTPIEALLGLQSFEGGLAGYSGANDTFSTYQGVPGIVGVPHPPRRLSTISYIYLPLVMD
jgi:prenyltransferase beta subunit